MLKYLYECIINELHIHNIYKLVYSLEKLIYSSTSHNFPSTVFSVHAEEISRFFYKIKISPFTSPYYLLTRNCLSREELKPKDGKRGILVKNLLTDVIVEER